MHGLSDPEIPPLGKSSYRNTCRHVRRQLFTKLLTASLFLAANNWEQSIPTNQRLVNEIMVHPQNGRPWSRGKTKWQDGMFDSLHFVSKESRLRMYILICLGMQKQCWKDSWETVNSGYLWGKGAAGQKIGAELEDSVMCTLLCLLVFEAS